MRVMPRSEGRRTGMKRSGETFLAVKFGAMDIDAYLCSQN